MKGLIFIPIIAVITVLGGCAKDATVNKEPVIFEIRQGDSMHAVANRLYQSKAIKDPARFRILAKLMRKDRSIQSGVYRINANELYRDVINKFAEGKTYSVRMTVPEGHNIFQIAELVENLGFDTKENFLSVVRAPELLARYNIPPGLSLEGYLFPDTYFIPLNHKSRQIVEMMLSQFDRVVDRKLRNIIEQRGMTLHKVLTLASIIEKESSVEHEKPVISGVFHNRMRKGMKLQADPTLIYSLFLAGEWDGRIRFRHFNIECPYNTYRYVTIPPGPISSVGLTSIQAAIFPAKVDYLYFVAMSPGGEHYFSKTLKEHNAAVDKYIRGR